MEIREANPADIPLLVLFGQKLTKMHLDFDPEYYTFDEKEFPSAFANWIRSQIDLPSSIVVVAKENDEIVGFLSGFVKYLFPWFNIKKVGHVSFMFIDEKYRGKGVGTKMVDAAKRWFKNEGLYYIELYVNENNKNGLSFWKNMGFKDFQKFLRMKF